jgi:threonine aldolase
MKHLFGGAMRQAGIVAAAGIYALENNVERLVEDHANARRLAEGLAEAGLPVDLEQVETNFVLLDVGSLGLTADDAVARLRADGVLLSFAAKNDVLRAVTHLDVIREDIEQAIERIPRALAASDRPVELAGDAPTPY